jgi:sirohydrochlorin cobaltochelatase
MKTGLILFGHGARDPRWALTMEALAKRCRARDPSLLVECAFLEFMSPDLQEAVASLVSAGAQHVVIAPVFLAAGGHVLRDLPDRAAGLSAAFPGVSVQIEPALGASEPVIEAMAQVCMEAVLIPHDRIARSFDPGRAPGAIGATD